MTLFKKVFDDYNRILMLKEFEDDCAEVLSNSGDGARYNRALKRKCKYLQDNIDDIHGRYRKEYLEPMKGKTAAGFAKIPISGNKKNYRVILCFIMINGVENALYLHFFQEKKARTDYANAIAVARKRYKVISE